jgi:hypothetical protein
VLGVGVGVVLGGFFGVVRGLEMMAVRHVGVMAGFFVIAGFVVVGGRAMVLGGVLVMIGRLAMMIGAFFRHGNPRCFLRFGSQDVRHPAIVYPRQITAK